MRVLVDLNRCESYGQCVFLAPEVFGWHGRESLEYVHEPGDAQWERVAGAAAACPVRAIVVGRSDPR